VTPALALELSANAPIRTDADAAGPTETPVVSVIVSTRNHAQYLGATLAAIEAQTYRELELVLVDNASTDETQTVVREFLARTTRPVTYLRFTSDHGPAVGRSAALERARGEFVAFTDSDCVPSPGWVAAAVAAFAAGEQVGIVQGRTECYEPTSPMFSHFIETLHFDSSFSTSNVIYRRAALDGHRFDGTCAYWEDTDLGFRVRNDGWDFAFADEALVYHQVVPQTALGWLLWPRRYANWPAKTARYPEFRNTLFLRVWVDPMHAWFDLALVGAVATAVGRRRLGLSLLVPYVVSFARTRGLRGRAPVVKAGLHVLRDGVAFSALIAGSVRHRSVVL
jgi:glycosyltransferase involved in cell wall biosynthesis